MATPQRLAVIITALPLERAAVIEHLREVGEEPALRGSIYRRGVFDDRSEPWDVVVAEIGAGNEGAAAEAERVIARYSPQVALFVGIGGAVKDLTQGDVVASTKVYGYECGKDSPGRFRPRSSVQLPDYALEQRARYEAGEKGWLQRIKGETGMTSAPAAKVGPIAAGEKVLASNRSQIYKFLREHYGDALAVEMEGHGFLLGVRMNHPTQGIVIRSISDRIGDKDEANDEIWQPVAARHAAAFAFQLIANLSPAHGGQARNAAAAPPTQQINVGDVSGDNNTLNIHQQLAPNLEDLRRLLGLGASMQSADQPLLRNGEIESPNLFWYGSQKIAFRGRVPELEWLGCFLKSDAPFAWYVITGPGGAGKSRLALELCLRHKEGWYAGFLDRSAVADFNYWKRWRPHRPTLLVVDYAVAQAETIGEMARLIRDKGHHEPFKIRLLIIEREKKDWYDRFLGKGASERELTLAAKYPGRAEPPLELGSLDDEDIWLVMHSIRPALLEKDKSLVLARLRELDPEARVLWAAFFAASTVGREESSSSVLRDVLLRERECLWKQAGVTDLDIRLLAVATMCGGAPLSNLQGRSAWLDEAAQQFSPLRYQAIVGRRANVALSPLEPDILGEFFVLDWLTTIADVQLLDLLNGAWLANTQGTFEFLRRVLIDFPQHEAIPRLFTPRVLAMQVVDCCKAIEADLARPLGPAPFTFVGAAQQAAYASFAFDKLTRLIGQARKEEEQSAYAIAAYNLVCCYTQPALVSHRIWFPASSLLKPIIADLLAGGDLAYQAFRSFASNYPGSAEQRALLAQSAGRLCASYTQTGDDDKGTRLYADIIELATLHPAEASLRVEVARAQFNLVLMHQKKQEVTKAEAYYRDLCTLVKQYPGEPILSDKRDKAGELLGLKVPVSRK